MAAAEIDGLEQRGGKLFNVTLELVRRGYTEEQIGKLWSGNLLRVWGGKWIKSLSNLQKKRG